MIVEVKVPIVSSVFEFERTKINAPNISFSVSIKNPALARYVSIYSITCLPVTPLYVYAPFSALTAAILKHTPKSGVFVPE